MTWRATSGKWLCSPASSYPGAPYERKYMALDLLNAVADTWGVGGEGHDHPFSAHAAATTTATAATAAGTVEIDAASEAAAAEMEVWPYAPPSFLPVCLLLSPISPTPPPLLPPVPSFPPLLPPLHFPLLLRSYC